MGHGKTGGDLKREKEVRLIKVAIAFVPFPILPYVDAEVEEFHVEQHHFGIHARRVGRWIHFQCVGFGGRCLS